MKFISHRKDTFYIYFFLFVIRLSSKRLKQFDSLRTLSSGGAQPVQP